jgi:hypothetical protein
MTARDELHAFRSDAHLRGKSHDSKAQSVLEAAPCSDFLRAGKRFIAFVEQNRDILADRAYGGDVVPFADAMKRLCKNTNEDIVDSDRVYYTNILLGTSDVADGLEAFPNIKQVFNNLHAYRVAAHEKGQSADSRHPDVLAAADSFAFRQIVAPMLAFVADEHDKVAAVFPAAFMEIVQRLQNTCKAAKRVFKDEERVYAANMLLSEVLGKELAAVLASKFSKFDKNGALNVADKLAAALEPIDAFRQVAHKKGQSDYYADELVLEHGSCAQFRAATREFLAFVSENEDVLVQSVRDFAESMKGTCAQAKAKLGEFIFDDEALPALDKAPLNRKDEL